MTSSQTHGHIDHVAGLKATKAALPAATIHLHAKERVQYYGPMMHICQFG